MKSVLQATIAASALLASFSHAQDLPKVLDVPISAGMRVAASFDAEGGLKGWVLVKGVNKVIAYTTPDGNHMLLGRLIDASDTNLTLKHLEEHVMGRGY